MTAFVGWSLWLFWAHSDRTIGNEDVMTKTACVGLQYDIASGMLVGAAGQEPLGRSIPGCVQRRGARAVHRVSLLRYIGLLTPGALWVTGSCDTETSSLAIYRAMKLSVTLWRAKAARVRAEGGCANRHLPGAVLA